MTRRDQEVIDRLLEFDTPEAAVASGLFLFHGTVETFDTPLRPGSYDGVFWTARSPAVAQTYIPESGASTLLAWDDFRANDRVTPIAGNGWWSIVARAMGVDIDAADPEFDAYGRLRSWRNVEGHPNYAQARAFLEEQGYQIKPSQVFEIKCRITKDGDLLLPADHRNPGRLFVLHAPEPLRFKDLSIGEGDLMAPDCHRLDDFRRAELEGYDGVIIDDFAQSKRWGNVGHRAWGLFTPALERVAQLELPAVAFDWDDTLGENKGVTPEFSAAFEDLRAEMSPAFT